jgi:hypothetical protein
MQMLKQWMKILSGSCLLALAMIFFASNAGAVSSIASENVSFSIPLSELGLTTMPSNPKFLLEGFDGSTYPVTVLRAAVGDHSIFCGITHAMPAGSYSLLFVNGAVNVELPDTVRVSAPVIQDISVQHKQISEGNQVVLSGLYFGNSPSVSIVTDQLRSVPCQIVSDGASDLSAGAGFGQVIVEIPSVGGTTPKNAVFQVSNIFGTASVYYDAQADQSGHANSRGKFISASEMGAITPDGKWDYLCKSIAGTDWWVKREAVSNYLYYWCGHGFYLQYGRSKYPVKIYRITYWTVDDDAGSHLVKASGVAIVPQVAGKKTLPFLSFQHGTMMNKNEAPSMSDGAELGFAVSYAVADGFVVSMMDHQGMGTASYLADSDADRRALQRYCQGKVLAMGAADMMIAVKQFVGQSYPNITLQNLYMTGYSEGAYATLALQKELETKAAYYSQFALPALKITACGDGPYSLAGAMLNKLLSGKAYPESALYFAPLIMVSMFQTYFPASTPIDYFIRPYDISIGDLITGYVSSESVNRNMPKSCNPADILTDKVKNDLNQRNTDSTSIYTYFLHNDLAGNNKSDTWMPAGRLYFYHGILDDCVPYQNSQDAYNHYVPRTVTFQKPTDEIDKNNNPLHKTGLTYHAIYALHVMGEIWSVFHSDLK